MEINASFQFLFVQTGQRDTLRNPILVPTEYTFERILDIFSHFSKKITGIQPKYTSFLYVKFLKPTLILYLAEKVPVWISF